MIGIYHSRDLDGFCSGAIIKKRHPNALMIGYDYGEPIPDIPETDTIVIADVSFPMDQMHTLSKKCKKLIWIDHHISAINGYYQWMADMQYKPFMDVILDSTKSACEGAWKYFFNRPVPPMVELLGKYDTWREANTPEWNNRILPFQYGMRAICNSLDTFPEDVLSLVPDFEIECTIAGRAIIAYQAKIDEKSCRDGAFEIDFDGYRAICLNSNNFSSITFKSIYDPARHDLMLGFKYNGKFWVVSIYTDKDIDLSKLAKARGGGGHAKAAGFEMDDITELWSNQAAISNALSHIYKQEDEAIENFVKRKL